MNIQWTKLHDPYKFYDHNIDIVFGCAVRKIIFIVSEYLWSCVVMNHDHETSWMTEVGKWWDNMPTMVWDAGLWRIWSVVSMTWKSEIIFHVSIIFDIWKLWSCYISILAIMMVGSLFYINDCNIVIIRIVLLKCNCNIVILVWFM